ncbi:hypothetical protein HAX54_025073 [Datura stramonium]|uniref:Uncharacterized protein n=1 Tax=Datura stramonium TaxID=4076 RepID=A0ABS8UYW8_DATST|nr:hypothetical protein [Datura stramonium]
MVSDGECLTELIRSCRNKCSSLLVAENLSLSRLCYLKLWGSRNRRALILGWAYYLDAFSSYPLRTWLPQRFSVGTITGTPEVRPSRSSRTRESPTLEHTTAPGGEEPLEVPNLPVDVSSWEDHCYP